MRINKNWVIVALICAGLVVLVGRSSSTMKSAEAKEAESGLAAGFSTYEQAFTKAKADNKLILLDFYTDWCGWCKRMDRDVYSDASVQAELGKYFTAAKVNAEATVSHTYLGEQRTEQQIARHLGITGYPTLIFMTPDGQVVEKIPGYVQASEFTMVLRFIGTGAYKTQEYQSWKKTQS